MKNKVKAVFAVLVCSSLIALSASSIIKEEPIVDVSKESLESRPTDISDTGSFPFNESGEVFYYWYAPENSFGIQETKTLNTTYIQGWANNYIHTILNASVTGNSGTWLDASDGLTEDWNWTIENDSISAKISWTINTSTAPTDLYYRLIWAIDSRCKNFINGSTNGTQVQFDIPLGPDNETVSFFFNFSDILPLIQNNSVTVHRGLKTVGNNSYFYAMIKTVDKLPPDFGVFVIDPTFGETGTGTVTQAFIGDIWGSCATPASNGTIDNITAYISFDGPANARCAIYNNATKKRVAVTEEKSVNTSATFAYVVFNISGSINVYNDILYYICVWSSVDSLRFQSGGYYFREKTDYNGTFRYTALNEAEGYSTVCIYASYTASGGGGWSNTAPVNSVPNPTNGATGIGLSPANFSIKVTDVNDANQSMNLTFRTNASGTWKDCQTNQSSVINDTYYNLNTTWITAYSTKYWWSVNTSDNHTTRGWDNDTYSFTTVSTPWSNTAPTVTTPNPTNGSSGVALNPSNFSVKITDKNDANQSMNLTFRTNASGSWKDADTNSSVNNGTYYCLNKTWITVYSTLYYWSVNVSDGHSGWDNETYHFTTTSEGWSNTAPVNSVPNPTNGSTSISLSPSNFSIKVVDKNNQNQTMNITFRTNASGSWKDADTNTTVSNGTYYCLNTTWITAYNTKYWWSVNTSDNHSTKGWDNDTYYFTTQLEDTVPWQSGVKPSNGTTGKGLAIHLYVMCIDNTSVTMNGTWWSNSSGTWAQFAPSNTSVANNTNISQVNSNFTDFSTTYYWTLNLSDGNSFTNKTYHYTTIANSNPENSVPSPANGSTGQALNPTLQITLYDNNSNTMNQTFRTNASGTWADIDWNNNSGNATVSNTTTIFDGYSTEYWWSSNTTDGHSGWDNETYSFTTLANTAPVNSVPSPANESTGIALNPTLQIVINDANGHTMNQTFWSNASGTWNEVGFNNNSANATVSNASGTLFDTYLTTYYWSSNVTDGHGGWDNDTYHFTTMATPATGGGGGGGSVPLRTEIYFTGWTKEGNARFIYIFGGDIVKRITGYDTIIITSEGTIDRLKGFLRK